MASFLLYALLVKTMGTLIFFLLFLFLEGREGRSLGSQVREREERMKESRWETSISAILQIRNDKP